MILILNIININIKMEKIYYIGNLDKDLLLEKLWEDSKLILSNVPFDLNVAKKCMKNNYPDYVCGRAIKVNIYNEDNVDYSLYDRDNYDGAFLEVIKKINIPFIRPKYGTNINNKINNDAINIANNLSNDKKVINEAMQILNDLF